MFTRHAIRRDAGARRAHSGRSRFSSDRRLLPGPLASPGSASFGERGRLRDRPGPVRGAASSSGSSCEASARPSTCRRRCTGARSRSGSGRLLRELPFGETTTYGDLAESLGDRTLARRVGQAVGRNPLSIVVGCHRVVAGSSDGRGIAAARMIAGQPEVAVRPLPVGALDRRASSRPTARQVTTRRRSRRALRDLERERARDGPAEAIRQASRGATSISESRGHARAATRSSGEDTAISGGAPDRRRRDRSYSGWLATNASTNGQIGTTWSPRRRASSSAPVTSAAAETAAAQVRVDLGVQQSDHAAAAIAVHELAGRLAGGQQDVPALVGAILDGEVVVGQNLRLSPDRLGR